MFEFDKQIEKQMNKMYTKFGKISNKICKLFYKLNDEEMAICLVNQQQILVDTIKQHHLLRETIAIFEEDKKEKDKGEIK